MTAPSAAAAVGCTCARPQRGRLSTPHTATALVQHRVPGPAGALRPAWWGAARVTVSTAAAVCWCVRVEALALAEAVVNRLVHLAAAFKAHSSSGEDGEGLYGRGVVALVGATYEPGGVCNKAQHVSGAGEQRHHAQTTPVVVVVYGGGIHGV